MSAEITANCKCGAVCFTAQSEPILQVICHCTDCQEATGAAFARAAFFKLKSTRIVGELATQQFVAASGKRTTRESCSRCGELMFDRSEGFPV
jgi:hypothetical protein